jgi:hypothetical protein
LDIDGHPAPQEFAALQSGDGRTVHEGDLILRVGSRDFDVEAVADTVPIVKAFLGSFSLDTSGYPAAKVVAPSD